MDVVDCQRPPGAECLVHAVRGVDASGQHQQGARFGHRTSPWSCRPSGVSRCVVLRPPRGCDGRRNTRELRGDREVVEVRALTLGRVEREASASGLGRRDGGDDHATEPVGVEGRVQWPGFTACHLHVVRAFSPAVVRAGGGGDTEGDGAVFDGEITQHAAGEARQHEVAVLRLTLLAARLLGVDTGPQLQREPGVAGDVGDVEADPFAGVGVDDGVDAGHDREGVGVDVAERDGHLDAGHAGAGGDGDADVAVGVADLDLLTLRGLG
ncbi:hypothetical protein PIS_016 [Saccharomonospora phage PIS 136]|nr:hypothetical protein PIS_016 [Saccharomonospora phage PIS 136]